MFSELKGAAPALVQVGSRKAAATFLLLAVIYAATSFLSQRAIPARVLAVEDLLSQESFSIRFGAGDRLSIECFNAPCRQSMHPYMPTAGT